MTTRRGPSAMALGVVLALSGVGAAAQTTSPGNTLTLYGAYRDGGGFTDATTNRTLRLDASPAWAIAYDRDVDASRQLEFFVTYQSTHLELDPAASSNPQARTAPSSLPMKVLHVHVGGTNFVDGPVGQGFYVLGGLGLTLFEPGSSGYGDEVRPSLNLGLGYQVSLAQQLALRIEARGYAIVVHSSGGLFCSGGCVFKIKADTVTQGEAQIGLSYRF
jgi:hypothetical protein